MHAQEINSFKQPEHTFSVGDIIEISWRSSEVQRYSGIQRYICIQTPSGPNLCDPVKGSYVFSSDEQEMMIELRLIRTIDCIGRVPHNWVQLLTVCNSGIGN